MYGWRKYEVNDSKFDSKNPIFMYYAGLVATDGYIDTKNGRVSLRFSLEEANTLLNNLKGYFEFMGEVKQYNKSYDLTITSRHLIQELTTIGASGVSKTFTLEFPKLFYSEDCEKMYLRGIFDGDGNIHRAYKNNKWVGGQFSIVTGSTLFVEGLIKFINTKFSTNYSLSFHKMKGISYPKLEMKTRDSLLLYSWFYSGYEQYKLEHKYNKYLSIKR